MNVNSNAPQNERELRKQYDELIARVEADIRVMRKGRRRASSRSYRSPAWLDALERAIGEEAHFYRLELEEGYGVSIILGPRYQAPTLKALLEQLAQHYGI